MPENGTTHIRYCNGSIYFVKEDQYIEVEKYHVFDGDMITKSSLLSLPWQSVLLKYNSETKIMQIIWHKTTFKMNKGNNYLLHISAK